MEGIDDRLRRRNVKISDRDKLAAIGQLQRRPYIPEAIADLGAASRHMLSTPPHFGQAQYSASQAAEKLLKCVLQTKNLLGSVGGRSLGPGKWHDLHEIARVATQAGMPEIPRQVLTDASATAGARYGEVSATLEAAIDAQHAAHVIAARVHRHLG